MCHRREFLEKELVAGRGRGHRPRDSAGLCMVDLAKCDEWRSKKGENLDKRRVVRFSRACDVVRDGCEK